METTASKRKSAALTKEEWAAFKKFRSRFLTNVECAEVVGIDHQPLARILLIGRGSEESIKAIRTAINQSGLGTA
jgi:hypothetical protein